MIEKKVIVITDEMSEEQIFKMLNRDPAPLVADLRTVVAKSIEQIVRERYAENLFAPVPKNNNRPDDIKITAG